VQFSELQKLCDLDKLILTLCRVEVILVCISSRGLPTHWIRSKLEKLCGWTDGRSSRRTDL